jgi:hypothetical protein
MSKSGLCKGKASETELFYFANPPIHFSRVDPTTTHVFGAGDATFHNLDPVRRVTGSEPFATPTVLLLKSLGSSSSTTSSSTGCTHAVQAAHDRVFMQVRHDDVVDGGSGAPSSSQGHYFYKFDPRIVLVENTLEAPAVDPSNGNGTTTTTAMAGAGRTVTAGNANGGCPAVAKNFLNKDSCVRRSSCSPPQFSSAPIPLNTSTLLLWYRLSGTHVHYVTGLRLEDEYAVSPCTGTSRWKRAEGGGDCGTGGNNDAATPLDTATKATLTAVLAAVGGTDANPFVRDITDPVDHAAAPAGATCAATLNGVSTVGARVSVDGECWEHVHPHTYNVYDFSTWTLDHDGNNVALKAGRPNPIIRFALGGRADLAYPLHHPMARWSKSLTNKFKSLKGTHLGGRLGDTVSFSALPTSVQTPEMARRFGALSNAPAAAEATGALGGDSMLESCGSPGEVANLNTFGHQYHMQLHPEEQIYRNQELVRELVASLHYCTIALLHCTIALHYCTIALHCTRGGGGLLPYDQVHLTLVFRPHACACLSAISGAWLLTCTCLLLCINM